MSRISRELHRSLVRARSKPIDPGFARYKVFIQYVGHMFNGSSGKTKEKEAVTGGKRQNNTLLTVEDCLIKAAQLFVGVNGEYRNLSISSRTDTGVHAYRNCFQVDLPNKGAQGGSSYDALQVCRGFNYFLRSEDPSPGLAAMGAERLQDHEPFDCRASSTGRTYVYRILVPPANKNPTSKPESNVFAINLFADSFSWSLPHRLDVGRMQECAKLLVGERDFSTFRGSGCQSKSPYRMVSQLDIRTISAKEESGSSAYVGASGVTSNVFVGDKDLLFLRDNDLVIITITANAFLLKMVRNIVGALVAVGQGRLEVAGVKQALESRSRLALRCEPAPAKGLFLYNVHYDDQPSGGG